MRRLIALALVVLLLTPASAWAQVTIIGPGGVVHFTAASVTSENSSVAKKMYEFVVPAALVATSSQITRTGTQSTLNVVAASVPLHLTCQGRISAASSPNAYFGANFGGANATVTMLNGPVATNATMAIMPVTVDVWVSPVATATTGVSTFIQARMAYVQFPSTTGLSAASETVWNANTLGTINLASANTLNVVWQWGTAATGNALTFYKCVLVQGH